MQFWLKQKGVGEDMDWPEPSDTASGKTNFRCFGRFFGHCLLKLDRYIHNLWPSNTTLMSILNSMLLKNKKTIYWVVLEFGIFFKGAVIVSAWVMSRQRGWDLFRQVVGVDYEELQIQKINNSKSRKGGKKFLWLYVRLLLDLIRDAHSFLE